MTKKKIIEVKSKVKEVPHKSESKLEEEIEVFEDSDEDSDSKFVMHEIKVKPAIIREISDEVGTQEQNIPQTAPERTASRPAPVTYDFNTGRNPYDTRIRSDENTNSPTTLPANQQGSQNFRPILRENNTELDRSVNRQFAIGGEADTKKYYEAKQKRRYPWETGN